MRQARLLGDLMHDCEGVVDAVLTDGAALLEGRGDRIPIVPEHKKGVLAHKHAELARLRPLDRLGLHVDAAHEAALGPVEEEADLARAHAEQRAAEQSVRRKGRLERARLLEIFEELDRGLGLAHGILAAVERPNEVKAVAERLFAPGERCVDDVLAVARDDREAPVGIVLEALRVDLAHVELLSRKRESLTVRGLLRAHLV